MKDPMADGKFLDRAFKEATVKARAEAFKVREWILEWRGRLVWVNAKGETREYVKP